MRLLRLRTSLILLLVTAVTLTFTLVGSAILIYRLPQIEASNRAGLQQRAGNVSRLLDHYMAGIEAQIRTQAQPMVNRSPVELQAFLEAMVGTKAKQCRPRMWWPPTAAWRLSACQAPAARLLRNCVALTFQTSRCSARRARQQQQRENWPKHFLAAANLSDNFLSAISGKFAVGVAVPAGDKVVIGEVALEPKEFSWTDTLGR